MASADPPAWFLGDLDDPWVVGIARSLPPGTALLPCVGDLPDRWPSGLDETSTLVLHRPLLSQADANRIRRLRARTGGSPRIVLAVGPHARYRDLERWVPLVDAILPEATASETVGRHLAGAEEAPRPPGPRPPLAVVSSNFELRRVVVEAAEAAGYPARPATDWHVAAEARLVVWDVPVLEPDWAATLAERAPGRRVVALLGFADRETVSLARASGASACLDLPCDPADLRVVLDRLEARPGPTARERPDGPAGAVPPPPAHARARTSVRSVADRAADA